MRAKELHSNYFIVATVLLFSTSPAQANDTSFYAYGATANASQCDDNIFCDGFYSKSPHLRIKRKVKAKDVAKVLLDGVVMNKITLNYLRGGKKVRLNQFLDSDQTSTIRYNFSVFYQGGGLRFRNERDDLSLLLKKSPGDVDEGSVYTGFSVDIRW